MTRKCKRCGLDYTVTVAEQEHCITCGTEVARLIAADERRRWPRFPARDMTGLVTA